MKSGQLARLPDQWELTDIGSVYKVVGGGTPSTSNRDFWNGDMPWITSADIDGVRDINVSRYITTNAIEQSATNRVPKDTLLVVTRVGLGKIAIAESDICFSQDLQGLVQNPNIILPEYGLYFLSFELQRLKFEGRGTTISGLTKKQLKDTKFPLPPYNEQRRIVVKIEELLSELDNGITNLKMAGEQLSVYRQALLKHAFEGKLTDQWREEHKHTLETSEELFSRIKEARDTHFQRILRMRDAAPGNGARPGSLKSLAPLSKQDQSELPHLPSEWLWEKLGWVTCGVEYGTSAKSAASGDMPVLRMGNIQNAKIDWSDLVYSSDETEIRKYALKEGDVLFNRTNSPELVGKTAIYRDARPALFAGYLIRINQVPTIVDGQYLNLFLNSHVAKQHGNRVKTDGVNQSNINGQKLINYPFPFCSLPEQREIVRILGEKLSIIDQLEGDIARQLAKSEALRQTILKKAFSGRLVAQDESDEPASVLLERVRAEKEANNKKTRKKEAA